ncbi:MAG: helix-hairpin-helix domain-containing protein, partial [Anaerolineae bacterium]|nr:helix-hairpin-helix domain-containing protein [Anaerolineae bacterium]
MPGAEHDQVARAMQLADRVSVNLEAPNAPRLEQIAPGKGFDTELMTRLQWIEELRQHTQDESGPNRLRASSTTEFVVGPAGERDVELLSATEYLHKQLKLARVYFSAFRPVRDTPLDNFAPTNETRKLRLYQASFLLRDYDFTVEELPFVADGDLPQHTDPKCAWAEQHLVHAPIEINTASERDLKRIPGIGAIYAKRIMSARRKGTLRNLDDLRALGIHTTKRLTPYVLLAGRSPDQPRLF